MKIKNISFILIVLMMMLSINSESYAKVTKMNVKFKTNKGEINVKLFSEKSPVTVASFVNLVRRGYYNGLKFHRVIEDFMAQGGDPTGTGMGGPGYRFEDEVKNGLDFSVPGKLAMANAGPGTNGSQFFITTVPTEWLNGNHTIFGEVVSDKDLQVVKSLTNGDIMETVTISGEGIEEFLKKHKNRIDEWNKVLDK
ncbi:peptidylprolyl isomerase [Leptotrichia sp. OH3620_COT-345]|uniref:peptidylprolyl isomerase n=1 Tax=Leptotrichia sp. OH3620_COT-345 TaxID=2491048 RepID=UPI000F649F5A|nr:peptidylprolyl isomerase [Leptotrichia sp. OH3620_COT-345]RRD39065.1 peptidylprolyl isomerase [Leptotrichia sp. OH3620_COT-345]